MIQHYDGARHHFPINDVKSLSEVKMLEERSSYYIKALQNQIDILHKNPFDALELNKKRDEYWDAIHKHVATFIQVKQVWFSNFILH